jgi:hypothetical protein
MNVPMPFKLMMAFVHCISHANLFHCVKFQSNSFNTLILNLTKYHEIIQEGLDGPEITHLYIGRRGGANLNPRAFILTNLVDNH